MVAVAAHHVARVGDRPFREDLAVAEPARHAGVPAAHPFVLGWRELVERLVLDEEAQAVAEVEELRRRRIVAGADGVDADLFERAQAPLPDAVGHRGAEAAGVVVHADALELQRLLVQEEPAPGSNRMVRTPNVVSTSSATADSARRRCRSV